MLEPYAMKVARTVLRRGRTSNRSSLFDMVPGLKMASKVSIIICDIELGKPPRQEVAS